MLIFTDEFKKRPHAFLKFSNELWKLETLQKGTIYMNTIKYFVKLEEEAKIKGMGDKTEGALVATNIDFVLENEDNSLLLKGSAPYMEVRIDGDSQKHVFCMSYLDFSNLEIIEEGSNYVKCITNFTYEQKKRFIDDFGKYVMLISCANFTNSVITGFERKDIEWAENKVRYSDFSITHIDRIKSYMSNGSSKYFWKDKFFENQIEYRIIVLNRDSDVPLEINIDDMTGCSCIITTEKLFSNKFYLEVRFNTETDLILKQI